MSLIRTKLVFGMATLQLISTIIFSPTSYVIGQEVPPVIDIGSDGVLFAIGVENSDGLEFKSTGFTEINNYECTVGVNCGSWKFPSQLLEMSVAGRGVPRVTINFNLNQTYERVILRIVGRGIATIIVKLDDSVSHSLTIPDLSKPDYNQPFESWDISLGTIEAGIHNIKLIMGEGVMRWTMPEGYMEIEGTGNYEWDAIILLVK